VAEQAMPCGPGPIELTVVAEPEVFRFGCRQGDEPQTSTGFGGTHLLSTEVAGGFTGVFVAMTACAPSGSGAPAAFDWFDYEPLSQSMKCRNAGSRLFIWRSM
jgi:alpha-N-arabinofuranosidase